jgi:hypothetical protein
VPVEGKYTSLPASIIQGVIESMNAFILGNQNKGLFVNCMGVLDNDPNVDTTSIYYQSATFLSDLADNNIIQTLPDPNTNNGTTKTNLNLNPNLYRITVIYPDGIVAYDSNSSIDDNSKAKPPQEAIIKDNHFNRLSVLRALLYEGTDYKCFNEYKFSNSSGKMEFYSSVRIGSIIDPIGVLRISTLLTYK